MSESLSAPIPSQLISAVRSDDPLGEAAFRQHNLTVITERDTHIWSKYVPHENPAGTVVTQDGVPLPGVRGKLQFTVAEVAPERRWVVRPNGEILHQHEFESSLLLWREEYFFGVLGKKPYGDLRKEVIKSVDKFVSMTVDSANPKKLIPIGMAEAEARDKGKRPSEWMDSQDNDSSIGGNDRMRLLLHAYRNPDLRKRLKPYEIEECEKHIGESIAPVSDGGALMGRLEELNQMLKDKDITPAVHSKRVALLTGAPLPEMPAPDVQPVKVDEPARVMGGFVEIESPPVEAAPVMGGPEADRAAADFVALHDEVQGDLEKPDPMALAAPMPEPPKIQRNGMKRGWMKAPCGAEITTFQSNTHKAACPDCKTLERDEGA